MNRFREEEELLNAIRESLRSAVRTTRNGLRPQFHGRVVALLKKAARALEGLPAIQEAVTEEDRELAEEMFEKIKNFDKAFRANVERWATEIHAMREQDGRTHEEIREMFAFAQFPGSFWKSVVLNPMKLREKWTALAAQKLNGHTGGRQQHLGRIHGDGSDFAAFALTEPYGVSHAEQAASRVPTDETLKNWNPTNGGLAD